MSATTSIRTKAKQRLAELLASELPGVRVTYAWPGAQQIESDSVFLGNITAGEVTPAAMTTGRKPRHDRFTITVYLMAAEQGRGALEAEQRVEELYNAVENVCATYPTLNDLAGVGHAVQNGSTTGPESDPTVEGWVAFMTASVEVLSHLR